MSKRLTTDSHELQDRFDDAGTAAEIDAHGRVAVTNWPEASWSGGPSFLRDMVTEIEAEQSADKE